EVQSGAGGAAGNGNGGSAAATGGSGRGAGGAAGSSPGSGGAIGSGGNGNVDGGQTPDAGAIMPPPELTWTSEGAKAPFTAIWGSGPNDIYVIDVGAAYHSTGDGMWKAQTPLKPAGRLTAIWGSGPTDIYVSAFANVVFHSK